MAVGIFQDYDIADGCLVCGLVCKKTSISIFLEQYAQHDMRGVGQKTPTTGISAGRRNANEGAPPQLPPPISEKCHNAPVSRTVRSAARCRYHLTAARNHSLRGERITHMHSIPHFVTAFRADVTTRLPYALEACAGEAVAT
jgi:hypothetical protein